MTQHALSNLISKKELNKDKIEKIASLFALLAILTLVAYLFTGSEENVKTFVIIFFIFGGVTLFFLIVHSSILGNDINKLKIEYILNHYGSSVELEKKLKGLLYKQLDSFYAKTLELEQIKRNNSFNEI